MTVERGPALPDGNVIIPGALLGELRMSESIANLAAALCKAQALIAPAKMYTR